MGDLVRVLDGRTDVEKIEEEEDDYDYGFEDDYEPLYERFRSPADRYKISNDSQVRSIQKNYF